VSNFSPSAEDVRKAAMRRGIERRLGQVVLTFVLQGLALFLASGDLRWAMAWAYIALGIIVLAINASLLMTRDPELVAERSRTDAAKSWDRVLAPAMGAYGPIATWIAAGLDRRYQWSVDIALTVQLLALAFVALGYATWTWAMLSNRYFAGMVRIQSERGHSVATAGPYRYVRHPAYIAFIVMYLATAIALDSLWALVPAGAIAVITIIRTNLEDQTLRAELDGYQAYSRKVRFRLLPGIW